MIYCNLKNSTIISEKKLVTGWNYELKLVLKCLDKNGNNVKLSEIEKVFT